MVRLEDYGTWDEALKRLEASRKALLALLREADPAWLSAPLREGAWTPLMVAEHVALVEDSTARVLRRLRRLAAGENLPPVPVKPGEFKDGKPQAPEGVRPKGGLSLEEVLALIDRGTFSDGDRGLFSDIVESVVEEDHYMVAADFRAYMQCQATVDRAFENQDTWMRTAILNVARMGRFSSDRAIGEYAKRIWNVDRVSIPVSGNVR